MTGSRGFPSKPSELKLLQGVRTHRPVSDLEPKPKKVANIPDPPEWLTEGAKEIWQSRAEKLVKLGLLTEIDLDAFARYVDMLDRFKRVTSRLNSYNNFYYPIYAEQTQEQIDRGAPKVVKYLCTYPEVSMYNQLCKQLKGMEREFGLTPAARSTIEVKPMGEEKEAVESFLFGKSA